MADCYRPKNGSTFIKAKAEPLCSSATPMLEHLILVLATPQSFQTTAVSPSSLNDPAEAEWFQGHYIENTSNTDELVWIEIYKSDKVQDISLTQWLALTPADIVAATLKIPIDVVEGLKKEKQILIKGN